MDVTLKTTLDVTPCQETLKTALFFVNLSFVLFIFALADLGKGKSKFLLLSSRHNTYKRSWESYSFIVICVHKPEHIFFLKNHYGKQKNEKKNMKISTEDNMAMGKNRKKRYIQVISMSNEGMNEVMIETQTYFFFPITELIRSPEDSLMLERWQGPPAVVFFKFVCRFSHENEAGIYLFRAKKNEKKSVNKDFFSSE